MNYIFLDLEWNQPIDEAVTDPFYFDSEIIEIGAVKLNNEFEPVDEFKAFVRPTHYRAMNGKVVRLTKIRPQDLEKAPLFPAVCKEFLAWCGEAYCLCTWGPDDVPVLLDNMIIHQIEVPSIVYWCDLQRIFSCEIMRDEKKWSLENAVDTLGLPKERAHDALHDARNTYTICTRVDIPMFVDEYHLSYVEYEKEKLSGIMDGKAYSNIEELLKDESFASMICPFCGEKIAFGETVFYSEKSYFRYGKCKEGDEFLGRYRINRQHDETLLGKRLIYEMTDLLWDEYQDACNNNQAVPLPY